MSSLRWEVSICELHNDGVFFKVTRQIPDLGVSETRLFNVKDDALKQFYEWL
ncbi:hypothetical protein JW968_06355 [Candidatus Woesearchaeota archaeon]|nr:hypothetical protein [Candidatus Woesearchaeota archaeon]